MKMIRSARTGRFVPKTEAKSPEAIVQKRVALNSRNLKELAERATKIRGKAIEPADVSAVITAYRRMIDA